MRTRSSFKATALATFTGALLSITAVGLMLCAPVLAADKAVGDEKSYLYFRPAPVATSSFLSPTLPLLGMRAPETNIAPQLTFSPTGKAKDVTKGVSLQLRSRLQTAKADQIDLNRPQPSAYNVNLALGFRGFAVDAGVARTAEATHTLSEAVNLGLSYGGKDWRTRLSVSDEKRLAESALSLGVSQPQRALAFELGSSLQLAPNWALSGGIRYAIGQSMTAIRLSDPNQPNNRSVFVGTAFNF
jgi:hypothetical protein